jgi:hypothetical protein
MRAGLLSRRVGESESNCHCARLAWPTARGHCRSAALPPQARHWPVAAATCRQWSTGGPVTQWGPVATASASGSAVAQWASGPSHWGLSATMIRGLGPGGAGRASGGPGGRRPPSAAVRRAPWLAALLAAVLAESPSQRRVAVPRRAQPHCSGLKPRADEWSFSQEAENRNRDEAAICRCQPVKIINLSMKIAVFF